MKTKKYIAITVALVTTFLFYFGFVNLYSPNEQFEFDQDLKAEEFGV